TERPANTGIINRKTYVEGNTAVYINIKEGFIKNCTKLPPEKILDAIKKEPKFKIKANAQPEVLIMHTHATEGYQDVELGYFDKASTTRTTDNTKNTTRVGDEIEKQLIEAGIGVIHDKTLHDYPSYNGAYERSAVTVKKILKENPTIKVVLDVHRDAIQPDSDTMIAPVTTINGKNAAQVMIISGCDDGTMNMPNYMENLKLSVALQRQMEADYKTLARPIMFDYRKYNQNLTTGSILLEMGGHANTLDEAIYCGELVGKSLAKVLISLK
ncbi:MAG: stage II sporulation protein P, partial [Oscillospiraceae bacterium]